LAPRYQIERKSRFGQSHAHAAALLAARYGCAAAFLQPAL
jgi:hypothetical protein